MKLKFAWFVLAGILLMSTSCQNMKAKPESSPEGTYNGAAVSSSNVSRTLRISIETEENPLTGTYTLGSGGSLAEEKGKLTATVLGTILDMTLKPDAAGTTYTFSGTLGANNASITGTMKGLESGKTVTYTVNVAK